MAIFSPVFAWDFRSGEQLLGEGRRICRGNMELLGSGADKRSRFTDEQDSRFGGRWGRGECPDNSGADADNMACGFRLPLDVSAWTMREMDAGRNQVWYIACAYPHSTPGTSGSPTQSPVIQNYHQIPSDTSSSDFGSFRVRYHTTGAIQTNLAEISSATGLGVNNTVAHAPTQTTIGMNGNDVLVEYLIEFAPTDATLSSATQKHNLYVTLRSYGTNGSAYLAITQVAHYSAAATTTNTRMPASKLGADGYFTFGRSKDLVATNGMRGYYLAAVLGSRSGAVETNTTTIGNTMTEMRTLAGLRVDPRGRAGFRTR